MLQPNTDASSGHTFTACTALFAAPPRPATGHYPRGRSKQQEQHRHIIDQITACLLYTSRVQKSNYAAVEALALSLVLALSATSEVLALSEALADSEVLADAEVLAGSEALVLAGSDTDVLDGAVEALSLIHI